tara:strand:- start:203 stop:379 length:177 start_codon:yes stop_codon:yes gene_type:complete
MEVQVMEQVVQVVVDQVEDLLAHQGQQEHVTLEVVAVVLLVDQEALQVKLLEQVVQES